MEKILLSFVSTFGSATTQDTIDSVSSILIGLSLLIILYRIQKWIIKVNENTLYLKEVLQTYKQLQEEKEKETKKTSQTSDIDDGARDSRFVESTIATSTEDNSVEKNSCHYSIVANTGTISIAECEGNKSIAACTGAYSMAIAKNTSMNSIASNTGFKSVSENRGDFSISANIGEYSKAVSTGEYSVAIATSGRSSAKVEGEESIAIVCGTRGRANGKVGCWLILTERGEFNGQSYPLKDVKAIKVDGKEIKETKWYRLINGEIIEDGDIGDKIEP